METAGFELAPPLEHAANAGPSMAKAHVAVRIFQNEGMCQLPAPDSEKER
jgi:hypothetical protein